MGDGTCNLGVDPAFRWLVEAKLACEKRKRPRPGGRVCTCMHRTYQVEQLIVLQQICAAFFLLPYVFEERYHRFTHLFLIHVEKSR